MRVLSLAEQWPGPLATMLLADLGADVMLVERPGVGDPSRRYEGHFSALSRGKRSIALDLKAPEDHARMLALVDSADVLIEGFRPGVLDRLGLGAKALAARNPGLVYVSISSFGHSGPLRDVAGHDLSIQAACGQVDVAPGEEAEVNLPVLPLADVASGMFGAMGVIAALLGRARGSRAVPLDVSMQDCVAFLTAPLVLPHVNGTRAAPLPPRDPGYGVFRSRDGRQFTLSIAGEDHLWRKLCDILELPGARDLSEEQRVAARDTILLQLRERLAARDWDALEPLMRAERIAFGPVLPASEVPSNPQMASRGTFFDIVAGGRRERHVRQPVLFGGKAVRPAALAPKVGEHTAEILRELTDLRPRAGLTGER
jgi:crotonobetainyl-CoA:carnitine CoA-transferase CaiB-like acyl-CoA transferase